MTIQWGAFAKHMRVGIEVWTDGYDTYTPSINVYTAYYVQCDNVWDFDDDETLVLGGNAGGSFGFHNGLQPNQSLHIASYTVGGQGQSYGGGPTYTFSATLTGIYPGAGGGADPTASVQFTLPPRPQRAPTPPGTPVFSSIGPTAASASWSGSTDNGGAGIDNYTIQVATDAGFGTIVQDLWGNSLSRSISGLTPGKQYWGRTFAHNAVGWSSPSATASFTTLSGAKVLTAGVWKDAVVYARVGGAWVQAKVFKRVGGSWVT